MCLKQSLKRSNGTTANLKGDMLIIPKGFFRAERRESMGNKQTHGKLVDGHYIFIHCVYKNDTDVAHYNVNTH